MTGDYSLYTLFNNPEDVDYRVITAIISILVIGVFLLLTRHQKR
jgi:hypothetical protein